MGIPKQDSFLGGLDLFNDRTKLEVGKYPLLINGRSRNNFARPIRKPKLISSGLPSPTSGITYQGLYSAGNLGLVFANGSLYVCDFNVGETFYRLPNFQMGPSADSIYFQLVPASTINYMRKAKDATNLSDGVELFNTLAAPSPIAGLCQDGVSQPFIVLSDGTARVTKSYSQWTNDANGREYVPIGKQMVFSGSKLYISDGKQVFQSVSGRPLDFMVVIDVEGNSLPLEADGGAKNVSHRVFYEEITCLGRLATDGEDGYYAGGVGNSYIVTPDFTETVYGEPRRFKNRFVSNTGPSNNNSFLGDVNGDSTYVDLNGIRTFNSILQFRNAGKNSPFSLLISRLFDKDINQTVTACGQTDNYSCYAINTTYGPAVLWFDELRNVWDAIDLWSSDEVNGIIRQFAEIVTTNGQRRFFFLTTTGYLYEYFASDEIAECQLYIGDWSSGDPKTELKLGLVKCILDKPETAGSISATLFVDNKQQLTLTKLVSKSYTPSSVAMAVPFGDASEDSVNNLSFDFGRTLSGYKIGVLLKWNFLANLTSVSGDRIETLQQVNTPQQSAIDMKNSKSFLAGRLAVVVALLTLVVAGCSSTNIAELMKATAGSDATVRANVSTIYGTANFVRTNPRTNQTATISPDGTVTIGVK